MGQHGVPGGSAVFDFYLRYYPRMHERVLVARLVVDLKFWRRFVVSSPRSSFKFVLGLLPQNPNRLYSDASTSFGMAGVVLFGAHSVDGLFWQMS